MQKQVSFKNGLMNCRGAGQLGDTEVAGGGDVSWEPQNQRQRHPEGAQLCSSSSWEHCRAKQVSVPVPMGLPACCWHRELTAAPGEPPARGRAPKTSCELTWREERRAEPPQGLSLAETPWEHHKWNSHCSPGSQVLWGGQLRQGF